MGQIAFLRMVKDRTTSNILKEPAHGRILSDKEVEQWKDPALYISWVWTEISEAHHRIAFGNPRKVHAWKCPGELASLKRTDGSM